MRNKFFKIMICMAIVLMCFVLPGAKYMAKANETVYLGGFAAGFTITSRGAEIVGLSDVITESGLNSPSKDAGISVGDRLMSVGERDINCSRDIMRALSDHKSGNVIVIVKRNGEQLVKEVTPAKDINGLYKLGLFIRDNLNGIGTMTFIKKTGEFMALGHPIVEDSCGISEIVSGEMYRCSIIGVNKGVRGKAGELKGIFIKDVRLGMVKSNLEQGIRGVVDSKFDCKKLKEVEIDTIKMGSAKMVTSIDGIESEEYDISIVKVEDLAKGSKNFVVKVNDERLLKNAGGIVQGMSGSPILQNGKLVGAVTHVFLNDPTRGYGITIQNMFNAK